MNPEKPKAASGAYTQDGVPKGRTRLTPHLVVKPAAHALVFYQETFGARIVDTQKFPGSDAIAHAELDLGLGWLTLSDPLESYGLVAPDPDRGTSMSLAIYVPDVDAVTERAIQAGATLREPVATFVSGDRYASILDPFGVRWAIMTRVEDLSPEESQRRVAEWAQSQKA